MDRTSDGAAPGGANRTTADVCATLAELGRTLKGWSFYASGHAARHDLLDRAWRALQGELRRNGPLALEVRRGAFWLAGSEVAVGAGRIDELARQVYEHAVRRLVFDVELDAATLGGFLDVLITDPEALAADGGFEATFYEGTRRGLQVNESEWRALLARAEVAVWPEPLPDASASEETRAETDVPSPATPRDAAEPALDELGILGEAPLDELLEGDFAADPSARGDITAPIDLLDDLALEPAGEAPLAPDPGTAGSLERMEQLRELTDCDDDLHYRNLVRQIVYQAQERIARGEIDEAYRVLAVLGAHAGDDAKRSFAQRESASEALAQLAQGAALDDLVTRACDASADTSLQATSVLRELGSRCAPRVLDQLEIEMDTERRGRLTSVLLAIGEGASQTLADAITRGSKSRQRLALRLAGESQNPRLVPNLREAMLQGQDDVAREAAQALVRIGDVSSLEALAEGLACPRTAVASFAAYSLGSTGRVLAVAPLTAALDRALAGDDMTLAREFVRALGRLARSEGAPAIAAILARGSFFQRGKWRDLKLAAVTALSSLPGRIAGEALARATRSGDAQLRQAAALAQKRRADAKPA